MNRSVARLVPAAPALLAAPALARAALDQVTLHRNGQIINGASIEPNAIVGDYRIDFAKPDATTTVASAAPTPRPFRPRTRSSTRSTRIAMAA